MSRVLTTGLFLFVFCCGSLCQETEVLLKTSKGPIAGLRHDPYPATSCSADAFLGLPYGRVKARFQLAEACSGWTDMLPAKNEGPVCPQRGRAFSEDCLYLNVFTPVNASGTPGTLPVMVYIHGGAFTNHSASKERYGPDFLVNKGVVLVTINYRLGAAGFLTLGSKVAPGNLGLHDTLLALQWVQDEISTFGGDPTQVTLFGQSSGSAMTEMHYLSPRSTGMFKRVIAQSGSALSDWGHVTSTGGRRRALLLAEAVKCNTTQNDSAILLCLQQTDINVIIDNQNVPLHNHLEVAGKHLHFVPVLDSYLTADTPFFNDSLTNLMAQALKRSKPMMIGFTTDEGIRKFATDSWKMVENNLEAFIPFRVQPSLTPDRKHSLTREIKEHYFQDTPDQNKVQALVNIYTDSMWAYPSVRMSRYFADVTYGYLFSYDGSWAKTKPYFAKYRMKSVSHGDELRYLWYSPSDPQDLSTCPSNLPNLDIKDRMVEWWTNFARTGVPDPSWQTVSKGKYLVIDSTLSTINSSDFEKRYYKLWANMTQE